MLAIPTLPVEPDNHALHKYLTFSFVPGEDVPIRGVHCLSPGHVARWDGGRLEKIDYFTLKEQVDPRLADRKEAYTSSGVAAGRRSRAASTASQ